MVKAVKRSIKWNIALHLKLAIILLQINKNFLLIYFINRGNNNWGCILILNTETTELKLIVLAEHQSALIRHSEIGSHNCFRYAFDDHAHVVLQMYYLLQFQFTFVYCGFLIDRTAYALKKATFLLLFSIFLHYCWVNRLFIK